MNSLHYGLFHEHLPLPVPALRCSQFPADLVDRGDVQKTIFSRFNSRDVSKTSLRRFFETNQEIDACKMVSNSSLGDSFEMSQSDTKLWRLWDVIFSCLYMRQVFSSWNLVILKALHFHCMWVASFFCWLVSFKRCISNF